MLTGIHFLLTYTCTYECDHCFVFGSPEAEGTFTGDQISEVIDEAVKLDGVKDIYFEGGEPFLFYPLLLAGVKLAAGRDFTTGIVTNAYWALSESDAILWLKPLADAGLNYLSVSDDLFHGDDSTDRPALKAIVAARKLGVEVDSICIDQPRTERGDSIEKTKGEKVTGGGALIKGRAVEKLADQLSQFPAGDFDSCPHEDFSNPGRVHVDAYGHVHICQGVSMGNMWHTPLSRLVREYNPAQHPIAEPLNNGGPVQLAKKYGLEHQNRFADACHFCFYLRRDLIDKFPEYLAPRQIYGLK